MDLLNQLACLLYTVLGEKRQQKLTLSFSLYHSLTLLYCFKVSVQLLATCCYLIHLSYSLWGINVYTSAPAHLNLEILL